jgi:hypothetical protein
MTRFLTHYAVAPLFAMATERGSGAADSAPAKRVKRYEVTAFTRPDLRSGKTLDALIAAGRHVNFVVEHTDYKIAWELARKACRVGKLPTEDGGTEEIEPGSLTVKKVMTLDKATKSNVLSAVEFIRIAHQRDVTVSQKLQALYEELVPEPVRQKLEAELDEAEAEAAAEEDEAEAA